jgi:hypothetical protein
MDCKILKIKGSNDSMSSLSEKEINSEIKFVKEVFNFKY